MYLNVSQITDANCTYVRIHHVQCADCFIDLWMTHTCNFIYNSCKCQSLWEKLHWCVWVYWKSIWGYPERLNLKSRHVLRIGGKNIQNIQVHLWSWTISQLTKFSRSARDRLYTTHLQSNISASTHLLFIWYILKLSICSKSNSVATEYKRNAVNKYRTDLEESCLNVIIAWTCSIGWLDWFPVP